MYAEAIARGHVFNDGNKRTALACALTYSEAQGQHIPRNALLEEVTVLLAAGQWTRDEFASVLELFADVDPADNEIESRP